MKPRISILLTAAALLTGGYCYGQNYNQNTNVNQNTTVIHNFPITERVVEKPVYIERYRTVYVDRPQPARVAKKLTAPLVLHGYLWVYTEDIGNFKSQRDALEIIGNINRQAPFGRNDWRIPTSAELTVMEQNAAAVGLGDDIYIATDHANGVLRMVSTGPTVAEQRAEAARVAAAQQAEAARLAAERQRQAEEARQKAEAAAAESRRIADAKAVADERARLIKEEPIKAIKEFCGLEIKVRRSISWNNRNDSDTGWRLATNRDIEMMLGIDKNILDDLVSNLITTDSRIVKSYYRKNRVYGGQHDWVLEISNVWNRYGNKYTREYFDTVSNKRVIETNGEAYAKMKNFFDCIYVKVQ